MGRHDLSETKKLRPLALPRGWEQYNENTWINQSQGLAVILTAEEHDGRLWLHLSVSRKSRTPSYDDLCFVKSIFIGDRKAVQVFVPKSEHVNLHPYCLHLWAPIDHDPLPDFRIGGML